MLAQARKALADLPPAQRPQIVLVSVDPQRDTPEQLASYVRFFSPSFTGVTGTQDAIDEFTRALGVPVAISALENGDYTVDHSAAIFLIDPHGAMRALVLDSACARRHRRRLSPHRQRRLRSSSSCQSTMTDSSDRPESQPLGRPPVRSAAIRAAQAAAVALHLQRDAHRIARRSAA